jgi:Ca-activated chloride channel family protein
MLTENPGLLSPLALWLFLALPALFTVVARGIQRRKSLSERLTGEAARYQSLLLFCAIPTLLIVALSRPYWGFDLARVSETQDELMFVVDVSRSMLAKDVPPSRIALAKRKMRDVIDLALARGIPLRYGITIFAGGSYVLCPTTNDTAVVKQFIDEISPEMVSSLGSRIALGLKTALTRYEQKDSNSTQNTRQVKLLLISDGEDDVQAGREALELAKSGEIRIDVLGVGTTEGTHLTLDDGQYLYSANGEVVHTALNEGTLREIAQLSGGSYQRAGLTDDDIESLIQRRRVGIDQQSATQRTIVTYRELGPLAALLALATLLVLLTVQRHVLLSILIMAAALATSALPAAAQTPQASMAQTQSLLSSSEAARRGYEAYHNGDYSAAELAFREALQSDPHDTRLQQSHASALYKNGRAQEAAKAFHDAAEKTVQGREYFENTYNEGNALLQLGRYQEAIDAFGKALDVKPDDEQAAHNLRVARALLREQQSRPTPTPPSQKRNSPQPQETTQPSPTASDESEADKEDSQERQQQQKEHPQDSSKQDMAELAKSSSAPSPAPSLAPVPSSPSPSSTEPAPGEPPSIPTPIKEALPPQAETPDSAAGPENRKPTTANPAEDRPPTTQEADAWLESLPESPLIITKDRASRPLSGQTW